jgi:hypothetical protein
MMEAASTSEPAVSFYQTTRRNNPDDSHLQLTVQNICLEVVFVMAVNVDRELLEQVNRYRYNVEILV